MQPISKQSVRVTIFGQHYNLRASGDTGEIEELAAMVDDLMTSIASQTGTSDPSRAAVLACLHLADQLKAAQQEVTGVRERANDRARQVLQTLEQAENDFKNGR
ncbi:MAG: cell division protein ZapA [Bryobacteraceae bacterium]|nr:cell division protein ZapA [Bryobacteraceae bacterium]